MGVENLVRLKSAEIAANEDANAEDVGAELDQLVEALQNVSVPDVSSSWPTTVTSGRLVINTAARDLVVCDGTVAFGLHTLQVTAGQGLDQHDAVYVTAFGTAPTVKKADNTDLDTGHKYLGIMRLGVSSGSTGICRISGPIQGDSWGWEQPGPVWVSTAGGLTQTVPTPGGTTKFALAIGFAFDTNKIFLIPRYIYTEF
jgi:hypothetical protein